VKTGQSQRFLFLGDPLDLIDDGVLLDIDGTEEWEDSTPSGADILQHSVKR
jgi:hypothetical protein